MTRLPIPTRRMSEVIHFQHSGFDCYGQVSWLLKLDAYGTLVPDRPIEVFLEAGKVGTGIQSMARDTAVAISLALQFGVPLATIRTALTRNDDNTAAGPLGALLDLIKEPTDAGA